jgi:hypothetical protein
MPSNSGNHCSPLGWYHYRMLKRLISAFAVYFVCAVMKLLADWKSAEEGQNIVDNALEE